MASSRIGSGTVIYRMAAALMAVSIGCGCAALAGTAATSTGTAVSSAASDVVTSPSALDFVGHSTKVAFLSPAALLAHNSWTEGYVIGEQCYFKTPDPLFFVPNESQPTWDFAGRLDPSNHFEALEYKSLLTLGMGSGNVQLNSWPVRLVSLADMPSAYLSDRITLLNQTKLSAADQQELTQEYMQRSNDIAAVVQRLEADYSPSECPNPTRSAG